MKKYTIEDVSKLTKLSQKTIRRHIAGKSLLAVKVSNRWMIDEKDYSDWVESNYRENIMTDSEVFHNTLGSETALEAEFIDVSDLWHIDAWKKKEEINGLNFIDLFSGAGGLSLGMVMAGFNPIASVEIMDQAVETYKYNFIDIGGFNEYVESKDIRDKQTKKDLYDSVKGKSVDVIVGGFPCQGFSMAGNRIVTDERNTLYLDMLEIVTNLKPKFVVMENVEGLRSMLDGKIEEKIVEDFRKAGYNLSVATLNAADYYTPQKRKRVIFIGNRINLTTYHPAPILKEEEYITLGQAIGDLVKMKDSKSFNHITSNHSVEMQKRLKAVPEGKSLYGGYSDAWKKSPWDKPSCTIKENHGGVNIHPKLPRVITAREMARLQSFPDDFIFKGSKKWQLVQIGNAVPPNLGKAIGLAIIKSIKKEEH